MVNGFTFVTSYLPFPASLTTSSTKCPLFSTSLLSQSRLHKHKEKARWTPPGRMSGTPRAEMVQVSVPMKIEAPPDHCYALFSDLSLMPEWSRTLQSVERDSEDASYSTWRFSWTGISLSWRARDIDPRSGEQYVVRWQSISGLPHVGCVAFMPDTDGGDGKEEAKMTKVVFSVDYDIAALIAVVMQSSFVSSFVENAIKSDLESFRSFALRKFRARRLQSKS